MSQRTGELAEVVYPETDGEPMAENTLQYRWIVTLIEGLRVTFRDREDVFVAGDLLWYPVEGRPDISAAPDAMVAIGRPRGDRGSYLQFREGGVCPQVVFEVLSPTNTRPQMDRRREWYERYGVEEYYEYDPQRVVLRGWLREGGRLEPVAEMDGHVSPRLGIRFDMSLADADEMVVYRPEGRRFETYEEVEERAEEESRRADEQQRQAGEERRRADEAERRADEAERRAAALAERLRAMGIDPDAPDS